MRGPMDETRRNILRGLLVGSLIPDRRLLRLLEEIPGRAKHSGNTGAEAPAAFPGDPDLHGKVAGLPRLLICLNGTWESVLNGALEHIPEAGWSALRVPAMPFATHPPTTSIWYRQRVHISNEWVKPQRQFFLRLEKAGHYAAVYGNGQLAGKHFGQYTSFEADVTNALRAGQTNEIAILVHNASGPYVRPGVSLTDPMEGNAYRGATNQDYQRNWTGIVGDIFLGWRPVCHISNVFVVPSVRKRRLQVLLEVEGVDPEAAGLTLRAAILDNGEVIRQLPEAAVSENGAVRLEADWPNPVLWGPDPYGTPKLYVLRTELERAGEVVDRRFTRFGFREVWIEGRDVLLNGEKLWMIGTYFEKLAPIQYLNDRHSQSLMLGMMQAAGLNTLHGHWDGLGKTWLDLCDEMGMLVLGGFFCDGRPEIQSKADAGWVDWMAATCREWVREVRNHPSIVLWRPLDVLPDNLLFQTWAIYVRMAEQVRREDGTRPLADGSDVEAWAQGSLKSTPSVGLLPGRASGVEGQEQRHSISRADYDDCSRMENALGASHKPFLTKEIWTGFGDREGLSRFFRTFYEKSFVGGSTGIVVQHLPLVYRTGRLRITWLSESGKGNRDDISHITEMTSPNWCGPAQPISWPCDDSTSLPNWCDPAQPAGQATPYNDLFRDLYREFTKRAAIPHSGDIPGNVLVSGLEANEIAFLVPEEPVIGGAMGVRAAGDGTAWIIAVPPGAYRLHCGRGSASFQVAPQHPSGVPGYSSVQRIDVTRLLLKRAPQ